MIELRLDPILEQQVNAVAKNLDLTKSELIRKSFVENIGKQEKQTAWELGRDLFGKYASGRNDLSVNKRAVLKWIINLQRFLTFPL